MPKQVNIWAPILKGDSEPMMSLAVRCGEEAPNKDTYRVYLQDHLDTKILSNPKRSREEMQAMGGTSENPNPDLSGIPVGYPPSQRKICRASCEGGPPKASSKLEPLHGRVRCYP